MEVIKGEKVNVFRNGKETSIKVDDLKVSDVMTIGVFKGQYHCPEMPPAKIHYHLDNTDKLDYFRSNGLKMIVRNQKAVDFKDVVTQHKEKTHVSRMNLNS